MGKDVSVDIDVNKNKPGSPGKRFQSAIQNGISEGLEQSLDMLQEKGKRDAKDIVMLHDKVWNKELKNSFKTETHPYPRWYHHKGKIINTARHAEIVEKGLAPAGEITGSKPSVQDIIDWVDSEIEPNAYAKQKAEVANIGNWDPQLQALVVQYGTAKVIAAFAIARHIKDKGYSGIRFMEQTESKLKSQEVNVKNKVEKEIRREFRKKGLS